MFVVVYILGMVELCAKILQIMHSIFLGLCTELIPIPPMRELWAPFSTYFASLKIKSLLN